MSRPLYNQVKRSTDPDIPEPRFGIVSERLTIRPEPAGATSAHIAYGRVNGRLNWAYGSILGTGKDGGQEFRHSWNGP
jgi:hypothetical protein